MDKIKEKKNSLVILANNHNPTVLFGDFLIKSNIIESHDDIDGKKSVVTPGFARIRLKEGTNIQITEDQLVIDGKWGAEVFKIGDNYCKNLPHIPYRAIGINLIYSIKNFSPDNLLPDCNLKSMGINSITTAFEHDKGNCNVTIQKSQNDNEETEIKFNFDYQAPKDEVHKLGNIHIDLESERIKVIDIAKNYIKKLTS